VAVAADLFGSITFVRLDDRLVPPIGHRFTNPSIHPDPERRVALVRSVNYRLRSGRYAVADPDGIVRSQSFRTDLDADFGALPPVPIAERAAPCDERFDVRGFEDCRVFAHAGRECAIAAVRSWNAEGIAQQCLLHFDGDEIAAVTPLSEPADGHQKNWMPVVGAAAMTFVDRCAPLRLRVVDPASGDVRVVDDPDADEPEARSYRGGSQVIGVGDRRLAVIHEVGAVEGRRTYRHRFVSFDEHLRPDAASVAFSFVGRDVEFCAGLRLEGDKLIASFGVDDAEAWLARVPVDEVVASLRPFSDAPPAEAAGTADVVVAPDRPRAGVVSVTLAHRGREAALEAALVSVRDWVDRCVVVDTSGSPTVHAAAARAVGERLVALEWPWVDDFGAARSAALELAAAHTDAAWAVIVDSDETIEVDPVTCPDGVPAALAGVPAEVASLTTWSRDRTYTKVRFVRLPSSGRYVGLTHEYFDTTGRAQTPLAGVTFGERPKQPDELAAKAGRDVALLRRATAQRPRDGRWWYYLGDALEIAGRRLDAIAAFRRCTEVDAWPEQAAWAAFREAQLWVGFGDHDAAIERCTAGLARYPGVAELAWYAGYAAYHAGRPREAAAFANLAIVHGEYLGLSAETARTLFRHLPALYEGPFDVLRHAYRALGDDQGADRAEADHRAALAARLAAAPP